VYKNILLFYCYEGSDVLTLHDADQIARLIHIEDNDREMIVAAEGCRGEIHDLQTTVINLVVRDLIELYG
jgi:hypothetical protein